MGGSDPIRPGQVRKTLGTFAVCISIVKSNVGSGLLFLPRCAANGGALVFILGMFVVGGFSLSAACRLVETRNLIYEREGKLPNYGELVQICLPKNDLFRRYGLWQILINTSVIFLQCGFCVAYLISVSSLLNASIFPDARLDDLIVWTAIAIVPFTWIRKMTDLTIPNLIAISLILAATGVIFMLEHRARDRANFYEFTILRNRAVNNDWFDEWGAWNATVRGPLHQSLGGTVITTGSTKETSNTTENGTLGIHHVLSHALGTAPEAVHTNSTSTITTTTGVIAEAEKLLTENQLTHHVHGSRFLSHDIAFEPGYLLGTSIASTLASSMFNWFNGNGYIASGATESILSASSVLENVDVDDGDDDEDINDDGIDGTKDVTAHAQATTDRGVIILKPMKKKEKHKNEIDDQELKAITSLGKSNTTEALNVSTATKTANTTKKKKEKPSAKLHYDLAGEKHEEEEEETTSNDTSTNHASGSGSSSSHSNKHDTNHTKKVKHKKNAPSLPSWGVRLDKHEESLKEKLAIEHLLKNITNITGVNVTKELVNRTREREKIIEKQHKKEQAEAEHEARLGWWDWMEHKSERAWKSTQKGVDNVMSMISEEAEEEPEELITPHVYIVGTTSSVFVCLGTICLVFEGICSIIPTVSEMEKPHTFPVVYSFCLLFVALLFMTVGMNGYSAFGSATKPIILLNFTEPKTFDEALLVVIVKIGFSFALVLTFPFQFLPAARLMEDTWVKQLFLLEPCRKEICHDTKLCQAGIANHGEPVSTTSSQNQQASSSTDQQAVNTHDENNNNNFLSRIFNFDAGCGYQPVEGVKTNDLPPTPPNVVPLLDGDSPQHVPASEVTNPDLALANSRPQKTFIEKIPKAMFRTMFTFVLVLVAKEGRDVLDNFNSLIGCLLGVPLAFVYPGLSHMFYIRACAQADREALLRQLSKEDRKRLLYEEKEAAKKEGFFRRVVFSGVGGRRSYLIKRLSQEVHSTKNTPHDGDHNDDIIDPRESESSRKSSKSTSSKQVEFAVTGGVDADATTPENSRAIPKRGVMSTMEKGKPGWLARMSSGPLKHLISGTPDSVTSNTLANSSKVADPVGPTNLSTVVHDLEDNESLNSSKLGHDPGPGNATAALEIKGLTTPSAGAVEFSDLSPTARKLERIRRELGKIEERSRTVGDAVLVIVGIFVFVCSSTVNILIMTGLLH